MNDLVKRKFNESVSRRFKDVLTSLVRPRLLGVMNLVLSILYSQGTFKCLAGKVIFLNALV